MKFLYPPPFSFAKLLILAVPVFALGVFEPSVAAAITVTIDTPADNTDFDNGDTVEVRGSCSEADKLLSITLTNSYPGGSTTINAQVTSNSEGEWVYDHPGPNDWQVWGPGEWSVKVWDPNNPLTAKDFHDGFVAGEPE